MKAHRTDAVSLVFALIFLAAAAWWLLAQIMDLSLPAVGWFVAGALILIGIVGLFGALRSGRSGAPAAGPTTGPTAGPTAEPTASPTIGLGTSPTAEPTASPTIGLGTSPTTEPTIDLAASPTTDLTADLGGVGTTSPVRDGTERSGQD